MKFGSGEITNSGHTCFFKGLARFILVRAGTSIIAFSGVKQPRNWLDYQLNAHFRFPLITAGP